MFDRGEFLRKLALNAARLTGIAPLAENWTGGVGAILMLHRVTAAPAKPFGVNRHLTISPFFLDAVIADMKRRGYAFVSMDEVVERLKRGGAPSRFAAITADDAYRDNLTEALPVLESHDAPITIYVAPGLINGDVDLWWELVEDVVAARDRFYLPTPEGRVAVDCSSPSRKYDAIVRLHDFLTRDVREQDQRTIVRDLARGRGGGHAPPPRGPRVEGGAGGHPLPPPVRAPAQRTLARDLAGAVGGDSAAPRRETLMTWDEVRTTARHPLVTIGAHSVHHYNLRRLPEEDARREIADAAAMLAIELGETPKHMAYPYGYVWAVGEREVRLAEEAGFVSAVTTRHGLLQPAHGGHLHALPRLSVNGRYQCVAHVRTMLTGVTTPLANRGRIVVTV